MMYSALHFHDIVSGLTLQQCILLVVGTCMSQKSTSSLNIISLVGLGTRVVYVVILMILMIL